MMKKLVAELKGLFTYHEKVDELYATVDGKVFFKKHLAEVHAKNLPVEQREVYIAKRAEVMAITDDGSELPTATAEENKSDGAIETEVKDEKDEKPATDESSEKVNE